MIRSSFFPYVSLRFGFAAIIKGPFSYSKEAGNEEEQGGSYPMIMTGGEFLFIDRARLFTSVPISRGHQLITIIPSFPLCLIRGIRLIALFVYI